MNADETDGRWRGVREIQEHAAHKGRVGIISIGDYWIENYSDTQILAGYYPTGEIGVFAKADFEAYIAAFFGLNF